MNTRAHSFLYNVQKLWRRDAKTWEHMFAENNNEPKNEPQTMRA